MSAFPKNSARNSFFLILITNQTSFPLNGTHSTIGRKKHRMTFPPPTLEVCVPGLVFGVPNFFPSRTFKNILFPVLTQSRPFKTGHCPSRLSPKNETGIPEFGKTIVKTYTITTREPSIYESINHIQRQNCSFQKNKADFCVQRTLDSSYRGVPL